MTFPLSGRLVLVGAGKMGGALLQGWLERGLDVSQIEVVDPAPPPDTAAVLDRAGLKARSSAAKITEAEAVVVAVKPQILDEVLAGLIAVAPSRPVVLSVVAGKTISAFEHHLGADAAVVRTIPNTPAAIGRGITAMTFNRNVSEAQKSLASALLSAVGEVVTVADETLIDAVTAVSGSGPAYVFYLTECLSAAGCKIGLGEDLATALARATVAGAGELMHRSGLPAATLRRNVTSPKGTTEAALEVLMAKDGLMTLMEKTVAAAHRRGRELAG